ncbi:putative phosphatidate cytidylyltransferase 2 isoform X2 [Apostichopus japonicus]|uniref:Phosphatidate cytidylyltransferase n=2 Tax=Stichopus japonicus TaxID=307972 RepID=A0A2G8JPR7_STIJA|nr:putative phosphatidate cytidylyltransferase 2 isoform X2 [Apostichopus japonicus]
MFVLTLRKSHYLVQFTLFGWTHVALLIVVSQSNIICHSIFEGLIWFLISTSSVICNDIMAYMFGFFFGRTSLIKLSPKKTWEGFIGALFSTVAYGVLLAKYLAPYKMFTCPAEYNEESMTFELDCEPSSTFQYQEYMIPAFIQQITSLFGLHWESIEVMPIQLHAFVLSLFASVIAPFSGFFASGFKRAYKIKDFGDVFPGHGGIMDRFDCQLMMASFHYVYMATFIRSPNPLRVLQQVFQLPGDSQLLIYNELQKSLINDGLLDPPAIEP